MSDFKLSVSPDFITALIESSGPQARLEMQRWVAREVAEYMLEQYREDAEDREIKSELLDEFCSPAKNYWESNRVSLLEGLRKEIGVQVERGVDSLISKRISELLADVNSKVDAYAKSIQLQVDQALEKRMLEVTESFIESRVRDRLKEIAKRLDATAGA